MAVSDDLGTALSASELIVADQDEQSKAQPVDPMMEGEEELLNKLELIPLSFSDSLNRSLGHSLGEVEVSHEGFVAILVVLLS